MMNLLENMDIYSVLVFLGFIAISVLVVIFISVLGTREKTYEEAIAEQKQKAQEVALQTKSEKPVKEKNVKKKKHLRKTKESKNEKGTDNDDEPLLETSMTVVKPAIAAEQSTEKLYKAKQQNTYKKSSVQEHGNTPETSDAIAPREAIHQVEHKPTIANSESKNQDKREKRDDVKAKSAAESKSKEVKKEKEEKVKTPKAKTADDAKPKEDEKGKVNKSNKEEVKILKGEEQVRGTRSDKEEQDVKVKGSKAKPEPKETATKSKDEKEEKLPKAGKGKGDEKPKSDNVVKREDNLITKSKSHGRGDEADIIQIVSVNKKDDKVEAKNKTNRSEAKNEVATKKDDAQPPSSSPKKKKPKSDLGYGDSAVNGTRLVTALKNATLTEGEVQTMIEFLLNRQQDGDSWVKSGQKVDPISALKKQLSDTEQALANEKQLSQTTTAKVKEMRLEMGRFGQIERQLREKLTGMQQEYQALQVHLQNMVDQHANEVGTLQMKFQQVQGKSEEDHRLAVRRVKDENEQLQRAIAQLEAETKSMTAGELGRLQHEVEQWRNNSEQLQAQLGTAQQGHNELVHQLQQRIQDLEATKSQNENVLQQRISELMNQLQQMEASESSIQKDLCQLQTLQAENASLRNQVHSLETASCSYKASLQDLENQFRVIEDSKTRSIMEIENRQEDASKLINTLNEEKRVQHNLIEKLTEESKQKDSLVSKLQEEVSNFTCDVQRLTKEVDLQREKNNEKVTEELDRQQQDVRTVLERIFPNLSSQSSSDFTEWLQRIEAQGKESLVSPSSDKNEELTSAQESELISLRSEVQRYQEVLTETESTLHRLEAKAETEEQTWKQRLVENEAEMQQLKEEKKVLEEEKSALESTLEQIRAAEEAAAEMQEKLRELQDKLQGEENERRLLEVKFNEAGKNVSQLQNQLDETRKELEVVRGEQTEVVDQKKDLEIQLDKERKHAKELSSQNIKFNSLVRIGQDSLKAEQEVVKELQKQLSELNKNTTTNGSACSSSESIDVPSHKK